jgi:flagellar hook assembly protein FlgD
MAYLLKISVYNEAGELVRAIIVAGTYNAMTNVVTDINGNHAATTLGSSGLMNITIPGVELDGSALSVTWDSKTDGGQLAASGAYIIRVDQVDTYKRDTAVIIPVTVIRNETYVELDIYNSAGELVRSIIDYNFVFPPGSAPGPAVGVNMDVPALILSNKGNAAPVQIRFGTPVNDFMLWDGKNNNGMAVSSGVYVAKILIKTESMLIAVAISNVTVLKLDNVFLSGIKAVPNPYDGTGNGIELRWGANDTGTAVISIYNIKGELVSTIHEKLETGRAMWNITTSRGNQVSNGLYVAVLQGVSSSGNRGNLRIKLYVNRMPVSTQ